MGRQGVVCALCATLLKHYGRGNDGEQRAICFATCHVCLCQHHLLPSFSQVGSGVGTHCVHTHVQTEGSSNMKLPDVEKQDVTVEESQLILHLKLPSWITHLVN